MCAAGAPPPPIIITNVHRPDTPQPATIEQILEVAQTAAPRLERLIVAILQRLSKKRP